MANSRCAGAKSGSSCKTCSSVRAPLASDRRSCSIPSSQARRASGVMGVGATATVVEASPGRIPALEGRATRNAHPPAIAAIASSSAPPTIAPRQRRGASDGGRAVASEDLVLNALGETPGARKSGGTAEGVVRSPSESRLATISSIDANRLAGDFAMARWIVASIRGGSGSAFDRSGGGSRLRIWETTFNPSPFCQGTLPENSS